MKVRTHNVPEGNVFNLFVCLSTRGGEGTPVLSWSLSCPGVASFTVWGYCVGATLSLLWVHPHSQTSPELDYPLPNLFRTRLTPFPTSPGQGYHPPPTSSGQGFLLPQLLQDRVIPLSNLSKTGFIPPTSLGQGSSPLILSMTELSPSPNLSRTPSLNLSRRGLFPSHHLRASGYARRLSRLKIIS